MKRQKPLIQVLDTHTSIKPTSQDSQFVVEQSTTVNVEDDVNLSKTAQVVGAIQTVTGPDKATDETIDQVAQALAKLKQ